MYIEWRNGVPYDKDGNEIQFLSDRKINELHTHLDTEEEYEADTIAGEYGEFWRFMDNCPSMWAVSNDSERYLSDSGKRRKLYPRRHQVIEEIEKGISRQEIDHELVPLIPIMEYKLVPTGNIVYYDPLSTSYDRKMMRLEEEKQARIDNKKKRKNEWQRHEEYLQEIMSERGRNVAPIGTKVQMERRLKEKEEDKKDEE